MEVKHCTLTAKVILKYTTEEKLTNIYLTIVQGDDVLDAVKNEITKYVRMMRLHEVYVGYKIEKLSLDAIRDPVTCIGCLQDLGNQEAHARYPGDCLYEK